MAKISTLDEAADDRFVEPLLWEGRLLVGSAPAWPVTDRGLALVRTASAAARRFLAGPPLDEALDTSITALAIVYRFGWLHLSSPRPSIKDDPGLSMAPPRSAAEHFAGDLAFRFLPGLYRRIAGRNEHDELIPPLVRLLREWPLSGVLADIDEPPLKSVQFDHVGLAYLYAERLAQNERHGWQPADRDREAAEVVRDILGKPSLIMDEPALEAIDS